MGKCKLNVLKLEKCELSNTNLKEKKGLNLYITLLFQDLATHTRITPEKRHQVMLRYLDTIRGNPEALAELTNWGIQLDNDILPVSHKKNGN